MRALHRTNFSYNLPEQAIAQTPANPRDASKLLRLRRDSGDITHHMFRDLPDLLQPGDLLVMNNSKVFPGRLYGVKTATGGSVEILLLHPVASSKAEQTWEIMINGKYLKPGVKCTFAEGAIHGVLGERQGEVSWHMRFMHTAAELQNLVMAHGETPLPPYITEHQLNEEEKRTQYQTVYAQEQGSAAAPTAGLHFTPAVFAAIEERGVERAEVTLHVGPGTFSPVWADDIREHTMHAEYISLSEESATRINAAKEAGRRVIAVGTTSVRVLESRATNGRVTAGAQWTDIFITPGYEFQIIDGLLTNFHVPESTLLMLVAAVAGRESILRAYTEALNNDYRFLSFGDAMLID